MDWHSVADQLSVRRPSRAALLNIKRQAHASRVRAEGAPVAVFSISRRQSTGRTPSNEMWNCAVFSTLDGWCSTISGTTAYRELVNAWEAVLPSRSMCSQVPVVMPNEFGGR
jgi:hypothetical protein